MSHIKIKLKPQGAIARDLGLEVKLLRVGEAVEAAAVVAGGHLSVSEVTFPYAPDLDAFNNEPLLTVFVSEVRDADLDVTVTILDDGTGLVFVPTDDTEVTWTTAPVDPFITGVVTIPAGSDQTRFRVEGLAVGTYAITASASGFDTATGQSIVIECPPQDPTGFEIIATAWATSDEFSDQFWTYGKVTFGPGPGYAPTYVIGQFDLSGDPGFTQTSGGPCHLPLGLGVYEGSVLMVRRLGYTCPHVTSWNVSGATPNGYASGAPVYVYNNATDFSFPSPPVGSSTDADSITIYLHNALGGPTLGSTITVALSDNPSFNVQFKIGP